MKVMKFGGSSLADRSRIDAVCNIVEKEKEGVALVLSAMGGVTDTLLELAQQAVVGEDYEGLFNTLIKRHRETAGNEQILKTLEPLFEELTSLLRGVTLIGELSLRSRDLIVSFGERLSASLVTECLNERSLNARFCDARNFIVTDECFGNAAVDMEKSAIKIRENINEDGGVYVATGFIASSPSGSTTTLGRNGSDYTATILGAALNSTNVEIWTDVDGILTADPRIIDKAFVIPEMSVQEAMEMSYFGAEVIHPRTLLPLMGRDIPLVIKNTFNPTAPGTIVRRADTINRGNQRAVTGITSIDDAALINVEGGKMGMPGILSKLFDALGKSQVDVIMISQASSEHSICLACRRNDAEQGAEALRETLGEELERGVVQKIEVTGNLEIVAVIGENMRGHIGLTGEVFSLLGKEGINILAIAQGSTERNISFIIDRKHRKKALKTLHAGFIEM